VFPIRYCWLVYRYTYNSTIVEISHETPRLACFAYPHKCKKASFSRTAAHIFVSPGDALGVITLNVMWMEREFDAYKLPRWMCPSNYNCFSDRARYWSKIVIFSYPLAFDAPVSGVPVGTSPLRLVWKKLEWCGYQTVKKFRRYLYSFWRNSRTWRTDGRTPGDSIYRACAYASRGKKKSKISNPQRLRYWSSIENIALNCLFFRKPRFCVRVSGDRLTDRRTDGHHRVKHLLLREDT